jgi:hypothetical protein
MLRGFARFSEELGEEARGGQGFADASGARKKVAGGDAVLGKSALEEIDRLGLADKLGEGHGRIGERKTNMIGQFSFGCRI